MIRLIKVLKIEPLDGFKCRVDFSDGSTGVRDFSDIIAEGGPMVEPLREQAFFRRVYVEFGVPAWPNGFDLDAIELHREMAAAGLLSRDAAE